jgi:hypothetical protein
MIRIQARDVTIDKCEIRNGGSSGFANKMISIGSTSVKVDNATIVNNRFLAIDTSSSGTHKGVLVGNCSSDGTIVSDGISILDNVFSGVMQDAAIYSFSSGTVHTNLKVAGNTIYLGPTGGSSAVAIDFNSAVTGILADNRITNVTASNIAALLDPGSLLCTENYGADTIDTTGIVIPIAVTT